MLTTTPPENQTPTPDPQVVAGVNTNRDPVVTPSLSVEDANEICRLAALPPIEYDRQRKAAAKRLGVQVGTLDDYVLKARVSNDEAAAPQGKAVKLDTVKPWGDPVRADVLDSIADTLRRYVALSPEDADALTLWCAHTHIFEVFNHTPRLNITAPEKGCGKTTCLDVIELFMPISVRTENLTVAVLFRVIDQFSPVILADEYDTWLKRSSDKSEELRGLLNAGHSATSGGVWRCVGDNHELQQFKAHSPAVLCGIGELPGTLHDRSIIVRLSRAKPGEVAERFNRNDVQEEKILCRKLARWCSDNRMAIQEAEPAMPEGAHNRVADNWRPLFQIAEVAGWEERCLKTFKKLAAVEADDEDGTRLHLLADIRSVIKGLPSIFSSTLCARLNGLEESPWQEKRGGHGLNAYLLAKLLKPFGITSKGLWIPELHEGKQVFDASGKAKRDYAKGYETKSFTNAFDRFLPAT